MKVIGVDVGSGSVRAAVIEFTKNDAKLLATFTKSTTTESPNPDWYEQNSSDIWDSVIHCVKVSS